MRLFAIFVILPAPCVMMEMVGDDCLPAIADVDVLHDLLPRLVELSEGFQG